MPLIEAIIVDDEPSARDTLRGMLNNYCPEVIITGFAASIPEALSLLETVMPKLVFLDIKIGDSSGFDLLSTTDQAGFSVVFTTAHDQFALRAIKFGALDYLLKPIDPDELMEAVKKAQVSPKLNEKLSVMMGHVNNAPRQDLSIVLPVSDGFQVSKIEDIEFVEADRSYSNIHFADKSRLLVSRSLKELDDILVGHGFIRTHKSYLVNTAHVMRFKSLDRGGVLVLQSGSVAEVARSRKQEVVDLIKQDHLNL